MMHRLLINLNVTKESVVKVVVAALITALLFGSLVGMATATDESPACAPEFIIEEQEVQVGTEYEYQLQQWAIFKWVNNGQPFFSAEEPDEPGLFKRYIATGNEHPLYEAQQVEVPNPGYDPECGQEPEVTPEPETYVTVAWLLPIDFTTWDGLGQPSGFEAGGVIWPQTYFSHAETGESVNLDALDGLELAKCSVVQVDTYPASAGLHLTSGLGWGDDHGVVISWKFLANEDCTTEPENTPTPEPTETPEIPYDDPTPEPPVEETPVVEPPVASSSARCVGDDMVFTLVVDGETSEVVAEGAPECVRVQVADEVAGPTVEPVVPQPAHAGHGVAMPETSNPLYAGLLLGVLIGAMVYLREQVD